ncbi:proline-rich receptor-like protein kinase PERK10 [Papaver somniferum]|uniref:proline-rich receptor-like protein kinase PERK10 n=1 Tax=Papaver somniferum TaxID=3469 RepID=UPI000E702E8D|nr:proline-rich receptor-like protein kinase PERK10 [Papaver somniferum]
MTENQIDHPVINLLSSFTNQCSKCGIMKRRRSSSSAASSSPSSSSKSPDNHPSKIQPNSTNNIISPSFSNPNNPSQLRSMSSASTPVSPSPTLTLLPPSSKFVSSAFSTPSSTPNCILSLACGQFGGGGGSQRQDSPLQSISNSPVSPSSHSFVPPSLGCPSSVSPPSPLSHSFVPPSPSPPLLSPPLVSPPPPRKPSPFSTPTKSRQGLISSASSTPLSSPSCTLCIECGGGSKRKGFPLLLSPSSGAKSNGGGSSTPPSAAAKKRWMSVRNALKQMQHKWMMDNISQQLKEQNNGAPEIAVNEKPNIDINSQGVYGTVPSEQNAGVVQEVVHDENVSFDRDGDTMRVCYMCCCGRQKQIFFAISN